MFILCHKKYKNDALKHYFKSKCQLKDKLCITFLLVLLHLKLEWCRSMLYFERVLTLKCVFYISNKNISEGKFSLTIKSNSLLAKLKSCGKQSLRNTFCWNSSEATPWEDRSSFRCLSQSCNEFWFELYGPSISCISSLFEFKFR